jgi:hypothetical protein
MSMLSGVIAVGHLGALGSTESVRMPCLNALYTVGDETINIKSSQNISPRGCQYLLFCLSISGNIRICCHSILGKY